MEIPFPPSFPSATSTFPFCCASIPEPLISFTFLFAVSILASSKSYCASTSGKSDAPSTVTFTVSDALLLLPLAVNFKVYSPAFVKLTFVEVASLFEKFTSASSRASSTLHFTAGSVCNHALSLALP